MHQAQTTVVVVTPDNGIFALYNSHRGKLGIIVPSFRAWESCSAVSLTLVNYCLVLSERRKGNKLPNMATEMCL